MKFAGLTLATLAGVKASNLNEAGNQVFRAVTTGILDGSVTLDATSDPPFTVLRTITQVDMDLINRYGCWCYFQDDYGAGKGKPVDEIDTLCKRLHDGYTCAQMDSQDLGDDPVCIPWEVEYNSAIGSGQLVNMDIATIRSECDAQNPDNGCPNWVCKIEGYFLQQLVLYFTHGGQINHQFRHQMGFDVNVGCPVSVGIKSDKACCDEYPLRFPFKTYNGSRDCCYTHTFNTNLYMCCPDGKVKMSC